MSQIRLVADSSCDLLSLDGVDFVSVPLTLRTETEEFRDDARLDVDAMVSTLRASKGRSYSACPNVADWEKAFGESGDVLAFTITSSLSGSYSAACVAKQSCEERDPSRRIRVVDTLSAGPETMLLLEKAASAQRGGASFDEVYRVVEELHEQVDGEMTSAAAVGLEYIVGVVEKNGELFFMHLKNDLSRIVALRVHLEGNIVVDIGSIHEIRQTRVARKAFPVKGERQPRRQEDHDDLTTPHEIRMHKREKETAHGHATPQ